tara:strand:+ start:2517 stop:5504 length:2988 start_codon:yes stop_codon:yes gene_type:complete
MAKQRLNTPLFQGGLNTLLDPRDINPQELSMAKNVMFDKNGIIRCIGKGLSMNNELPYIAMDNLSHGYGFYSFESGYSAGLYDTGSSTGGAYLENELFTHEGIDINGENSLSKYWYMLADSTSQVHLYSIGGQNWSQSINLTDNPNNVLKAIYHTADEATRISDSNISISHTSKNKWFGFIKSTNFFNSSAVNDDYYFNGWFELDNDIKSPTEIDFVTGGDPLDGTSGNATGFEVKIEATTGGSLDFTEEMNADSTQLIYDLGATFIYDGIQESLMFEVEDKTIQDSGGNATDETSDNALNVSIGLKTGFNPRITGGRIYYKKANSNEDYVLLCDIDFSKGVRASLDNSHLDSSWSGSGTTNATMTSNVALVTAKNLDTYTSLTEWGEKEKRISIGCMTDYPVDSSLEGLKISEGYKSSTIVNRRAFIANCKLYHDETSGVATGESFVERDKIYYSGLCSRNGVTFEPAYDCFPRYNYIDVVKGDGEEYTVLKGYADRLLAYKSNSLYIINVAGRPSQWFLESQHKGLGVSRPCQVVESEDGIMWANKNGAYVYTGGEVRTTTTEDISFGSDIVNLSKSKIATREWFTEDKLISVGYLLNKQQLLIISDTSNGNSSVSYIYDFNTNTWSQGTENTVLPLTGSTGQISNFIFNHNYDLSWASLSDIVPGTELVVNGNFSQDVADGTSGFMNDDNESDGYGQTVDGYTGVMVNTPTDNQRVFVEIGVPNKLYHRHQRGSLDEGWFQTMHGYLEYTIPTSLSAGETYKISYIASPGGNNPTTFYTDIYKSGSPVQTINTIEDVTEPTNIISYHLIPTGDGGSYKLRLRASQSSGLSYVNYRDWWFSSLSVTSVTSGNLIDFNKFNNVNTIIGALDVERFKMPANSIDIRTKDYDFGELSLKKRVYGVYITYRTKDSTQTAPVSYALDGASAYNNNSSNWTNLTGNMSNTLGEWKVGKFYPSSPLTCQSIRLKITNPSEGIVEINDIAIEYRISGRKVA